MQDIFREQSEIYVCLVANEPQIKSEKNYSRSRKALSLNKGAQEEWVFSYKETGCQKESMECVNW